MDIGVNLINQRIHADVCHAQVIACGWLCRLVSPGGVKRRLVICWFFIFGILAHPLLGYNPHRGPSFSAQPYDAKDEKGHFVQDFKREYYFNFHNVVESAPVYIMVYRSYRGYYCHHEYQVSGAQRVYSTPRVDVYGLQVPLSGGRIVVTEKLKPVEMKAIRAKVWDAKKKAKNKPPAGAKRIKHKWPKIRVSDPIPLCVNLDWNPVPPMEKTTTGALIALNDDDDDRNGQADWKDEINKDEDDELVRLTVQHPPGVPVSLNWDPSIVRLYKTSAKKYKGEYSSLMGNGNVSYKGYDNQIAYVEGIAPGATFLTVTGPGGFKDRLKITVTRIGIAMDGNRDGEIKFTDHADANYVFWVNDDHDVMVKGKEDDAPPGPIRDCDDGIISCKRDLEDFTRLHLQVEGEVTKSSNVSYCLRFENTSNGIPAVNLFPAVNPSLDYIQNPTIAAQQINLGHELTLRERFISFFTRRKTASAVTFAHGSNIATIGITDGPLPAKLLKDNGEPTCFLLEGRKAGQGDLTFLIKQNGRLALKKSMQLELRPITTSYDKFTVSAAGTQDLVNATSGVANASSYEPEGRQYLLFVHGWNVQEWEKDRWTETVFKRLWWQGYKGRVGCFAWPTLTGFTTYNHSDLRAWRSAPALKDRLMILNATYPGEVRILAHSMGNVVAGEALRLSPDGLIRGYLAAQAAISAHMYDAQVPNNWSWWNLAAHAAKLAHMNDTQVPNNWSQWKTPNIYAHYFSGTDTNKPYLACNRNKADVMIHYFNTVDLALKVWRFNNKWKPAWHYNYSGSHDSYNPKAGDRFYYDSIMARNDERTMLFEDDRYEIFTMCAQSRSFPLGAESTPVDGFGDQIDLRNSFGFDGAHYSHSREFRSNIVDERWFWAAVVRDMLLIDER